MNPKSWISSCSSPSFFECYHGSTPFSSFFEGQREGKQGQSSVNLISLISDFLSSAGGAHSLILELNSKPDALTESKEAMLDLQARLRGSKDSSSATYTGGAGSGDSERAAKRIDAELKESIKKVCSSLVLLPSRLRGEALSELEIKKRADLELWVDYSIGKRS